MNVCFTELKSRNLCTLTLYAVVRQILAIGLVVPNCMVRVLVFVLDFLRCTVLVLVEEKVLFTLL